MSRLSRSGRSVVVGAALAIAVFGSGSAGALATAVGDGVRGLEAAAGARVATTLSPFNGRVAFLATPSDSPVRLKADPTEPAETRARRFLESHGVVFGVIDASRMALLRPAEVDDLGIEHVRFGQTYRGIPVTGGELSVHLRGAGVTAVNAKIVTGLVGVATVAALDAVRAENSVREALRPEFDLDQIVMTSPRLEIFNRGLLEDRPGPTRLAWHVEARASGLRELFWVDALDGSVLLHFSQLPHALDRKVFDAASGSSLPGTLVRSEIDPATGDADVDAAFEFLGDTWEYFWTEHGRDSYDGAGASLEASVDYCPSPLSCPYANAFWNGSQMVFGEGMPAADDITAHELTHAVIEHTADLFYYMQSGALSESYSDLFGELVDLANGAGTDGPEVRWLLGEDRGSGASRNMMDPTEFGDPAWMGDWRFVCEDPGEDGGGVHSNSGVPNHAFALAVDGGAYGGVTVAGIGPAKAGRIQYRALAHYLLSASSFLDNDRAVRQACQDLIGTADITAADCMEVGKALDAVGMDQPWCSETEGTAAVLCSAEKITSTLLFNDFEGGIGSWSAATATSTPVGTNVWGYGHDFATSGVSHLWGDLRPQCDPDLVEYTDSSVEMTVDVAIPASGAHLQFRHSFGFENYSEFEPHEFYDGGVIELSTNAGGGWIEAGDLISAGIRYRGSIDADFGNPLGGRPGFVGDSRGYSSTQLDLTSLAGQSVRFRFRIGTDDTTDFCDYGWFVDDLRIFECPVSCLRQPVSGCLECEPALVLAGIGGVDTLETYVGCDTITAGPDFGVGPGGDASLIAPVVILENGFFVEDDGRLTVVVE